MTKEIRHIRTFDNRPVKDGSLWVEAQPVAELLERLLKHYSVIGQSPPLDDARALLAALRKHESRPS